MTVIAIVTSIIVGALCVTNAIATVNMNDATAKMNEAVAKLNSTPTISAPLVPGETTDSNVK